MYKFLLRFWSKYDLIVFICLLIGSVSAGIAFGAAAGVAAFFLTLILIP